MSVNAIVALRVIQNGAGEAGSARPDAPVVPALRRPSVARRATAYVLRVTAEREHRLADRLDPAPCAPAHGAPAIAR